VPTPEPVPTPTAAPGTATWFAQYYNYPTVQTVGTAPVIAIISLGGGFLQSDLATYWTTTLKLPEVPTVLSFASGQASVPPFTGAGADGENALDLQISGALCPRATLIFVAAANTDAGFYNAVSSAVNGLSIAGNTYQPSVISISWGGPEASWSSATLTSFNTLFQTAVSRGITVTAAAGDNGSSDGVTTDSIPHTDFPASSPYVVACGGTSVANPSTETTWSYSPANNWGTGGGISAVFAEPAYQTGVVNYDAAETTHGRGVPDLALNADPDSGWTICLNGQLTSVGGTSCVAPAVAGFLGLLNLRYPSGFTSACFAIARNAPLRATVFKDITTGSNDDVALSGFYSASVGYDFCTGLGSFNGVLLQAALLALDSTLVTSR
jgi:kumamolisin